MKNLAEIRAESCLHPFASTPSMPSVLRRLPWIFDLTGVAMLAFILVFCRWQSIIYPLPLNPDEAQDAANALRIKAYGLNWNVLDGDTNGPLDSLINCWPYGLGWDVTFSTARLTACVLLFFVCVFVYLTIKSLSGRLIAALLVLPLVIFYSCTQDPNFLHLSSELLPISLLVAANYATIKLSMARSKPDGIRYLKFALIGMLLGAAPFAKLQAVPLAALIGTYSLFLAATDAPKERLRNIMALVAGALTPAICFLVPLLVSGHIQDFWKSYIVWALLYVESPLNMEGIFHLVDEDPVLRCVSYFVFWLALAGLLHPRLIDPGKAATRSHRLEMLYGLLLLVCAFWTVSRPGRDFAHYLMFVVPFAMVFCAYVVRDYTSHRKGVTVFCSYYALFAVLFSGMYFTQTPANYRAGYTTPIAQAFETESPHILSWLPIPKTHLLVWGWMPEWYVWSGITPATRDTTTGLETANTPLQGYYRSRFMSDIEASSPEVILDAAEGESFRFERKPEAPPSAFPEFAAYLSKNYTQLTPLQPSPDCPRLYVRNEYKAIIDSRFVTPASVTTSADLDHRDPAVAGAALFDNSVTEDTCSDYWLLPKGKLGSVDARFSKVESISQLMILNTGHSKYLDRESKDIEVKLLKSGATVEDRKVTMNSYPHWTSIDLGKPVDADELQVDILSYVGRGAGLHEIKIFRAEPGPTTGHQP